MIHYGAAMAGAVAAVGMVRLGFMGMFYLLPLGILAYCVNRETSRFCLFLCVLGDLMFALWMSFFFDHPLRASLLDALYFCLSCTVFCWVVAPPERGGRLLRIGGGYRLIIASGLTSLGMLGVFYLSGSGETISAMLRSQAESMVKLFGDSGNSADVVEQSVLQNMDVDKIARTIELVAWRGGALCSCAMLYFVTRQLSVAFALFFKRVRAGGNLLLFHVHQRVIWFLSLSLLGILGGRIGKLNPLEVISWNLLVCCALLYMAQGGAIKLFTMSRLAVTPLSRLIWNGAIILALFSPGVNMIFLGALVLLGIAENWVPFRVLRNTGSPPTPGAEP